MSSENNRVILERVDYSRLFSFTRIFRSFQMAVDPYKIVIAMLMIILISLAGILLDYLNGGKVVTGEFHNYVSVAEDSKAFDQWHEDQDAAYRTLMFSKMNSYYSVIESDANKLENAKAKAAEITTGENRWSKEALTNEVIRLRNLVFDKELKAQQVTFSEMVNPTQEDRKAHEEALNKICHNLRRETNHYETIKPKGVFHQGLKYALDIFSGLMDASTRVVLGLQPQALGLHHIQPDADVANPYIYQEHKKVQSDTVVGSLRLLIVSLPSWLWHTHKMYFILFSFFTYMVIVVLGGAISRMSMVEASKNEKITPSEALAYVRKRWLAYLLAPLTAPFIILAMGMVLAVAGMIFFNVYVADIIGGLLFFIALVLGMAMAFVALLWVAGVHLMYPCLSANGGDFLDASFRSLFYIWHRPWRSVVYYLTALVYGAATYIFVGLFIFLALYLTHMFTGMFVFGETSRGEPIFDAMFSPPVADSLKYKPELNELGATQSIAAICIWVWTYLLVGLLGAYAVNFYFASQSHIFLLLRHRCDGTDYTVLHVDEHERLFKAREISSPIAAATEVLSKETQAEPAQEPDAAVEENKESTPSEEPEEKKDEQE